MKELSKEERADIQNTGGIVVDSIEVIRRSMLNTEFTKLYNYMGMYNADEQEYPNYEDLEGKMTVQCDKIKWLLANKDYDHINK